MVIGFEHTSQSVSEDAGNVSVCVRILQPSGDSDAIEATSYSVAVQTHQNLAPGGEIT